MSLTSSRKKKTTKRTIAARPEFIKAGSAKGYLYKKAVVSLPSRTAMPISAARPQMIGDTNTAKFWIIGRSTKARA